MGYTHYWTGKRAATEQEWDEITAIFKKLMKATKLPIQYERDEPQKPEVSKTKIWFNGIDDDGHETFCLRPNELSFKFCKTARKPYDRTVIACLIIAHNIAPAAWDISSDGTQKEWNAVEDWMEPLLKQTFKVPTID